MTKRRRWAVVLLVLVGAIVLILLLGPTGSPKAAVVSFSRIQVDDRGHVVVAFDASIPNGYALKGTVMEGGWNAGGATLGPGGAFFLFRRLALPGTHRGSSELEFNLKAEKDPSAISSAQRSQLLVQEGKTYQVKEKAPFYIAKCGESYEVFLNLLGH